MNMELVSQQYRALSDCTNVLSGLTLYWWQRLITFSLGRIRVRKCNFIFVSKFGDKVFWVYMDATQSLFFISIFLLKLV